MNEHVTRTLTAMGLAMAAVFLPANPLFGAVEPTRRIDLGRLALGQRLVYEFHVENTDEIPLGIVRVTSTCKCVKILEYPETVMPGDKETIRAEVLVNVPGDYAFGIKVHPWEPDQKPSSLLLLVTVPRPKGSNPAFYVAAADLVGSSPAGVTFVDVRRMPPATGTVPGAIHLPLHAVKAMRSLRNRPVVLIDNGWRSPTTELECFRLQQQGFTSVRILDGGVQAWMAGGGALTGASGQSCGAISPNDYLSSRDFTDWIVVDAGVQSQQDILPDNALHAADDPGALDRTVAAVAALTSKRSGPAHILVVGHGSESSIDMANALKAVEGTVVFCLAGGDDALARHMRAMTTPTSGRTTRTSQTIGGRRAVRRIRRSCGGCS